MSFNFEKIMPKENPEVESKEVNDSLKEIPQNIDEEINETVIFDIEHLFSFFDTDTWGELLDMEIVTLCDLVGDVVSDQLDLQNPPEILFAELDDGDYGSYHPEGNVIMLNIDLMDNPYELLSTIIHEERHAYQYEHASLPEEQQTQLDKAFKENIDDYISPEDDYRGYRNQLLEMDAREYANEFISNPPDTIYEVEL